MYKIEYSKKSFKDIRKIPQQILIRIKNEIKLLSNDPRPIGVKKLTAQQAFYRIRIGRYRVIYLIQDEVLTILIIRIAHRKEVYESVS